MPLPPWIQFARSLDVAPVPTYGAQLRNLATEAQRQSERERETEREQARERRTEECNIFLLGVLACPGMGW